MLISTTLCRRDAMKRQAPFTCNSTHYLPMRAIVPPPSSFFPAKLLTCGKAASPTQRCLMGDVSSLDALCKAQGDLSIEHRAWSYYSDASMQQAVNTVS